MRTNFKSKRFCYNGIHKKVVPTHEKRGRLVLTSGTKGAHIFRDSAHIHQENRSNINLSSGDFSLIRVNVIPNQTVIVNLSGFASFEVWPEIGAISIFSGLVTNHVLHLVADGSGAVNICKLIASR